MNNLAKLHKIAQWTGSNFKFSVKTNKDQTPFVFPSWSKHKKEVNISCNYIDRKDKSENVISEWKFSEQNIW